MSSDQEFFTETMAMIYVDQGNPEKAAEIYRHLLTEQPEREDLAETLAGLEEEISAGGKKRMADVVPLLEEWIQLLIKYNSLRKLKKIQERIS
jgi:hypothetical protein